MPDKFDAIIRDLNRVRTSKRKPDVTGEQGHAYRLNPPLSEVEVVQFERQHNVILPDDYRQFLTHAGNGGAGPFYGLFKLGEMDDGFAFGPWGEFVGDLSKPFPRIKEWNDLSCNPNPDTCAEDEYDRLLESFEARYWGDTQLVNGAIPICHLGCALRHWLIITGPERNNIWCDNRADLGGLKPLCSPTGMPSFD